MPLLPAFCPQVMVLFVLGLIGLTYWVVVDTYAPGVGRPGILRKIGSVVVLIVFTALVRVPAPHVTAQRRQKGQRHDLSGWHQTPDAPGVPEERSIP